MKSLWYSGTKEFFYDFTFKYFFDPLYFIGVAEN